MSGFKNYDKYDATGLAELVRKKKVKASELYEEAIERIEKRNPALNAVVCKMYDSAKSDISRIKLSAPFAGVPFLVKDGLHRVAGVPYTVGSKQLRDYIPDRDSEVIRRYREAGLVILGKTNVPEFCLLPYVESELHGTCLNPWDRERTPGGSSGGSAAAVASGMVPMAAGNDGGGSIRIPASNCGLFGFKYTRGRTPLGPYSGEVWQGAASEGVLTRSVRDSAAILDLLSVPDSGAPYIIKPPEMPYVKEILKKPGKLKIGYSTRSIIDSEVHPECIKAVEDAAALCSKMGHSVKRDEPEIDGKAVAFNFMMLYMGEVAADIKMVGDVTGRKQRLKDYEPITSFFGFMGNVYSAGNFVSEMRYWNEVSRSYGRFFEDYDIFITPVGAYPPLKIGELKPKPSENAMVKLIITLGLGKFVKASGMVNKLAEATMQKFPFTQLANLAGLPSMSVPLHWTSDSLPCGVQFTGRIGDDATLFRLAAQLEKEKPWFNRRPDMG